MSQQKEAPRRPRTCWGRLHLSAGLGKLGVPLDKLKEVAGKWEVLESLLRMLPT